MAKYLAKVKELMPLEGRCIAVTDTLGDRDYGGTGRVELRRPDGSMVTTQSHSVLLEPNPAFSHSEIEIPLCISLPELKKEDVPPGTEIWLLDIAPPSKPCLVFYYKVLETHRQQDLFIVVADKHYGGKYREGELVELRMPDGTVLQDVESHASDYKSSDPRHVSLSFSDSRLTDIPVGTEIWKY